MCGLVSVITKKKNGFTQKQVDIFSQLLYADQLRGADGTGVFYNVKQGEGSIRVLKAAYKSSEFLALKEYDEVEATLFKESNFVVGHNRSATRGKITASCTHPFREKHITLVHNGTLLSHKELHKDYEVDSRAIAHSISEIGAKETIKKIDGAYALIWFDSEQKTLNFCRNYQRPLFIIETGVSFVLVSELELGLWILNRNGEIVIKSYPVAIDTLYSFHIDNFETYTEEPLETLKYTANWYTEWMQPNHTYKKKDPIYINKYEAPKKGIFTFGQKIKFRSGEITSNNCIEGEILRNQAMEDIYFGSLVPSDFEKVSRVKFYGNPKDLKRLAHKQLLIGTIGQTIIHNDRATYIVTQVQDISNMDYTKVAKILQLPHKDTEEEITVQCEWCKETTNKPNIVDQWSLCDTCASSMM